MSEINENKEPLNKNNKVPKLRFKEYNDDYLNYNFAYLYNIFNGLNKDKESFGLGYPIINYMDVNKHIFITKDIITGLVNTTQNEQKRFNITTNDILITRTSETKQEIAYASCLLDNIEKCVYSGFLLKASPKFCDKTYAPYITLLLHNSIYRKKLMRLATETSRALINSDNLSRINIIIPNIDEQKKIYYFFNLLEKKISNINEKITILKKYKKGLAKEAIKDTIFYWKNGAGNATALSNYLTEINEYSEKDGTYPHVTLSTEGISEKSDRYDRDFLVKDDNKKYKVTHINQLCYNPANLKFGVICINRYGDGIFSPIYVTFKVKNIDLEYLELIVTSIDFNRYSMKYQQGTVYERMSVSPEDLCKIKIVITDENKQKNISLTANILNKKISKLESELNNLMLIKSNLLNNMFI